jgi:hypothetical protein
MKRFLSVIAALCFATQAFAAGTIPVALVQQFNANGLPLVNCQLSIYVVGTVASPQYAYQDTALTQILPWPVTCDSTGRLPMFYLADGSVHVRLTDVAGVVQFDYPSMLVIGPSSGGGGGGGTVDPTTIAATGDIKFRLTTEFLTGWVKLNGQTIGSATSGATGRANADTQNLYVYLWTNCPNAHCAVAGGRGGTALADFGANKQIALPDMRARVLAGLDDMGTTAAGILQTKNMTGAGDTVTTPGGIGGEAVHTLIAAEAAILTLTSTVTDPGHTHTLTPNLVGPGGAGYQAGGNNAAGTGTTSSSMTGVTVATTSNAGGGSHNVTQPFMLGTWYEKL